MTEQKSQVFLVTGGTGKVGKRVAQQLRIIGHEARQASRHPQGDGHIKFDYDDPSTFADAVKGVNGVFLTEPSLHSNPIEQMQPLIDAAIDVGVQRFVLLAAQGCKHDSDYPAAPVYKYLIDKGVDYVVLNPGWFMQNFSEGSFARGIRDKNAIFSASEDGQMAFIDARDIAAAAVTGLTLPSSSSKLRKAYDMTGPRGYSHDEVAAIISSVTGREIQFIRVTEDQMVEGMVSAGLPRDHAVNLAQMDALASRGAFAPVLAGVKDLTGHDPVDFENFASKADWS